MTQEALKLALEALEDRVSLMKWQKARDAVKEALAQHDSVQAKPEPEQEPCDMRDFCIGCSPRNTDGSCPGENPNGACDCYVNGFNDGMKEMEQPAPVQQEPVALLLLQSKQNFERNFGPCWQADWIYSDLAELLDTTPPQPEQEPDDIASILACRDMLDAQPVPQRTWVGMTDEEIKKMRHLIDWTAGWSYNTFARAIEAKLKQKNGFAEENT